MPKVSIIIPVYNVEKYLKQCLDSVINQTLKDIEIICVNDCSPDNSSKILEEYACKDSRIKIINLEKNGGLGNARNVGMQHVTSNYVMFLDSDDWLDKSTCKLLYNHIHTNNNEFVMFNFYFYYENNTKKCHYNKFNVFLSQKDINHINPANLDKPFNLSAEAWYKIYKIDFLRRNNIKFLKGYNFEDQTFLTEILCKAKDISVLNIPLLYYRQRSNSITQDASNWKDYTYAVQKAISLIPKETPNMVKDIITLSKVSSLLYWFNKFKSADNSIKNEFYSQVHKCLSLCDKDCLERTKKYYNYKLVNKMLKNKSYKSYKFNLFISKIFDIQNIFSIKNSHNKKHKVITLLGIQLKIPRKLFLKKYSKLPIINNRIVFDNFNGIGYGCSPKYIAEEILKQNLPYELIWLVKDTTINNIPKGIKPVYFYSNDAMKYMSSAKFIIANCRRNYFIDKGFIKKDKQYYIQTWHGCLAFKKIEKDIEHNKTYENYLKAAKIDSKYMNYLVSPSEFDTKILKNCFYFDGEYLEVGYPRNDLFFYNDEEKNKIKNKVYDVLNIPKNKKMVLYSPTFRDSRCLDVYKFDTEKLIRTLNAKYNEDFVLVTRLHPNMQYKTYEMSVLFLNAINASSYDDIQELLLAADVLITDYSSCIFDFCLGLKPAFVFATDIKEYEQERSFYLDIHSMPFPVAQTEEELFNNISNLNESKYKTELSVFLEQRGSFDNGNAAKKIVEIIKEKIKE